MPYQDYRKCQLCGTWFVTFAPNGLFCSKRHQSIISSRRYYERHRQQVLDQQDEYRKRLKLEQSAT